MNKNKSNGRRFSSTDYLLRHFASGTLPENGYNKKTPIVTSTHNFTPQVEDLANIVKRAGDVATMKRIAHAAVTGNEEAIEALRDIHFYEDKEHSVDLRFTHVGPSVDGREIIFEAEYGHAPNGNLNASDRTKRHRTFVVPIDRRYLHGKTPKKVDLYHTNK